MMPENPEAVVQDHLTEAELLHILDITEHANSAAIPDLLGSLWVNRYYRETPLEENKDFTAVLNTYDRYWQDQAKNGQQPPQTDEAGTPDEKALIVGFQMSKKVDVNVPRDTLVAGIKAAIDQSTKNSEIAAKSVLNDPDSGLTDGDKEFLKGLIGASIDEQGVIAYSPVHPGRLEEIGKIPHMLVEAYHHRILPGYPGNPAEFDGTQELDTQQLDPHAVRLLHVIAAYRNQAKTAAGDSA
jgi:hypothetical protein